MRRGKVQKLEYYEAGAYGPHIFFVRALEYFITKLVSKGAKIDYQAFIEKPLDDLDMFAAEAGAKEISHLKGVIPLGGLNFLKNAVSGRRISLRQARRDVFLEFKGVSKNPVYVGRVSILTPEFQAPGVMTCMFIVAYNEVDAMDFMAEYYDSVRERNRITSCILSPTGEPMVEFRGMGWDDVILPQSVVAEVQHEVDTFFDSKALYAEHGLDWRRGILLAGPPGNGKTTICRAIASNSKVPVVYCAMKDGDMFGLLDNAQSTISQNAPCVAMFEDIDAFGVDPVIRSAFLNMLDGLHTCEGVLSVATTNAPDSLDSSFTGRPSRFDSFHILDNPVATEREKMLRCRLGKKVKNLSGEDIDQIVRSTDGFSAACVQEVATCSLYVAIKEKKPVTLKFLKDAVRKVRKHMKAARDGADKWSRGAMGYKADGTQGSVENE